MRSVRPAIAIALALSVVAVSVRPSLAFAADRASGSAGHPTDAATDADALIARGVSLREQGKDDEALTVFKRALATSPSPRARAQVALAEQALGLWVAAEADLAAALEASSDPWIAKNRGALDGALGVVRRHLGTLDVRGPEGAEVVLDGTPLGTLPPASPFRVEAGSRALEVRAKGFHSTTRNVEIPAGGVARETVTLVPLTQESSGDGSSRVPAATTSDDTGRSQRVLGLAFAGVGAALLVTGGVGLLVRQGIVDDYNTNCPGLGASQPAGCNDKVESARTWLTVSIVSLVAGGIFGVGGVTLWATAATGPKGTARAGADPSTRANVARGRDDARRVSCAPFVDRSASGLGCVGTF